ncbi:unnamed protein product, partial [marine sediment metagenome]
GEQGSGEIVYSPKNDWGNKDRCGGIHRLLELRKYDANR